MWNISRTGASARYCRLNRTKAKTSTGNITKRNHSLLVKLTTAKIPTMIVYNTSASKLITSLSCSESGDV